MKPPPLDLGRRYVAALGAHLAQSGEQALHQAYELGREALSDGLGLLDLSLLHHDALVQLMVPQDPAASEKSLLLASEFLAECLSPFEMTLRGYQEANQRLVSVNGELTRAHGQLKAEAEERRKAEEALLHAQKLQAVGLLAGGVAHHFNNALMVVLSSLELARGRVADERTANLLTAAKRGAERGAEVTRQLLSFSRQQMLQPRRLDPASWLDKVRPLLSRALGGDITLETAAEPGLPPIDVDPGQLELALLNLTVNAKDAMPSGGTFRITASFRRIDNGHLGLAGAFVAFEAADTGAGVAPDVLPRVFEPFFSTKAGGPGTGLGLSQVYGFTQQSGGGTEIESRPGVGARVRLYLPAAAGEARVEPVTPAPEPAAAAARTGQILVVEDDVDVADLARATLENLGYSVKLAYRGRSALDLVRHGEPVDLVFSDVIMPGGMSGVQLAQELRRVAPKLPVLLTSGYNDAIEAVTGAAVPFIGKPYRAEELDARIAELLRTAG